MESFVQSHFSGACPVLIPASAELEDRDKSAQLATRALEAVRVKNGKVKSFVRTPFEYIYIYLSLSLFLSLLNLGFSSPCFT